MKDLKKLLAAVAVSAFMAVSASAFAADAAPKPVMHHHHHHMMCKKDRKGHCMHHHMMMSPRAHETWMGTPAAPAYHPHD